MKKIALIMGALGVVFMAILTAIAYSVINNTENEANKARTQSAREARWPKEKEVVKEEVKEEVKPVTDETQK